VQPEGNVPKILTDMVDINGKVRNLYAFVPVVLNTIVDLEPSKRQIT
jgi:hypothetical protein